MKFHIRSITIIVIGYFTIGCSKPAATSSSGDPLIGYNRFMYSTNMRLDKAILRPVAVGYSTHVPAKLRKGIANFIGNIGTPLTSFHLLLQGRPIDSHTSLVRFLINSTIGVVGITDPASRFGIPAYKEDFGQTLAIWGVGSGPYLVLPILGPSNVRDTFGFIGDWYTPADLTNNWNKYEKISIVATKTVDIRASLLGADRMLERQVNPYAFLRESYNQARDKAIIEHLPKEQDQTIQEDDLLDFMD